MTLDGRQGRDMHCGVLRANLLVPPISRDPENHYTTKYAVLSELCEMSFNRKYKCFESFVSADTRHIMY